MEKVSEENIITLTKVYRPFWMTAIIRFFQFVIAPLVLAILIFIACAQVARSGEIVLARGEALLVQISSYFTRVQIVHEFVNPATLPLDKLVNNVADSAGVDHVILACLVNIESGDGSQQYRFEPKKFEDRARVDARLPEGERRAMASSHGLAHVMGFNAMPSCGVKWHQLYEPFTGLSCGARIIKANFARYSSVSDSGRRLWLAFRDYNGSGEDAEHYADKAMGCVGQKLYKGLVQ